MKKFSPVRARSRSRKFATFDIETRNWTSPYAVGFYDGHYYQFDTVYDFLKHVIGRHKQYRGWYIYAHNGGRFDMAFIKDCLEEYDDLKGLGYSEIFQGSSLIKLDLYIQKETKFNRITFVDSMPLFGNRYGLDKLTKAFKVMHQKYDFTEGKKIKDPYAYLYRLYKQKDPKFIRYLKNDCIGLWEVIWAFQREVPHLALSLASTALNTLKINYLKHEIPLNDTKTNDELRTAYYGGRTEIFRMYLPDNGGNYYYYDINSLYPYVMKEHEYPICRALKNTSPAKDCYMEEHGVTVAEIKAPDIYLPVLPVRTASPPKLFFPTGHFTGYWDNHLLRKAKDLGYKITPTKTFSFQKTDYIFKGFVDDLYKRRMEAKAEGNKTKDIICKLQLNSCYGKTGQHEYSEQLIKVAKGEPFPKNIIEVVNADYNYVKVRTKSKGNHFLPQIAIQVTALAQLRLYEYMEQILEKEGAIAYCDTDSIFTDTEIPVSGSLGDMKLEDKVKCGYFLLPKTYAYINSKDEFKTKAKGFEYKFRETLIEENFQDALFNGILTSFSYESEPKINTFKTSMRRHHKWVSMDKRTRSIQSMYDKRRILPDMDTEPYKFKDLT